MPVPHDALGARVDIDRRDGRVLVCEQTYLRLAGGDLGDLPDEAVRINDRVVVLDAVSDAGGDDDALLELARQLGGSRASRRR